MNIFCYENEERQKTLAVLTDENDCYHLPYENWNELIAEAEKQDISPSSLVQQSINNGEKLSDPFDSLQLLVPVEAPEVWAAGVTYQRSREARNYEATEGELDSGTFYDKVYDAERPEIFLKSTAARTVGPDSPVCIRSDSNWQVPEPELGLVLTSVGNIVGYTIGNDMSCRDIEGENPLYLPQAKVWKKSCSIGPVIRLADTVVDPYDLEIRCTVFRNESPIFDGDGKVGQLKRSLEELVQYLVRDNDVYDGTVLLTGTNIVPPNDFTLQQGDRIEIEISGIGTLRNTVEQVTGKTVAS
ncbi:2-dehydro-3-deoxy-D-arabinonate dehydratase [Geomicrobium halophilum]|uniref:2-dehydro-3-deoxy-D-arabinonate dehydratase n=1 Tax=Geomicrobium halophilum TaxID=549000 RepID=A0A841PIL6_9BACL|nr:fumarylacetoacetate hydrolase family protein [Geomicrobium halophilum]MBB6448640.1 2-dehydro-3-deoxy-D-arabinonate dehydratase [Geomicrobium halophilum]